MHNPRMEAKVRDRQAVDVSACDRTADGDYVLTRLWSPALAGLDFCDLDRQVWIWSIGRHRGTGAVLASDSNTFRGHPAYECLWLR